MLFFSKPSLPVSETAREVIDRSLAWFTEVWGEETLRAVPLVLPTPEFLPASWQETDAHARTVFERVCGYMRVDPARVRLELFQEEDPMDALRGSLPYWEGSSSGAAGLYQERQDAEGAQSLVITVQRRYLSDPIYYVATLAHELGHVLLLGDRRLSRDVEHMEPMTDLMTVFWGLGIFNANACFQFHQNSEGHEFRRLGYLSEEAWGYALARWSWLRGERRSDWGRYLSRNVNHYMRQSLKVLGDRRP
jgi:hypothetical protein